MQAIMWNNHVEDFIREEFRGDAPDELYGKLRDTTLDEIISSCYDTRWDETAGDEVYGLCTEIYQLMLDTRDTAEDVLTGICPIFLSDDDVVREVYSDRVLDDMDQSVGDMIEGCQAAHTALALQWVENYNAFSAFEVNGRTYYRYNY